MVSSYGTDLGTWTYHNTGPWVIFFYECSTGRYVRLNALNILHLHGPRFNTPFFTRICIAINQHFIVAHHKCTKYNVMVHYLIFQLRYKSGYY